MKEKVKDLDPVLQKLIEEKVSIQFNKPDLYAEPLLEMIDWKLATNSERLKYADLMYGKGVVFKTVVSDRHIVSSGEFELNGDDILDVDSNWCVYYEGEWAEIISRPDEKEETKEPFKIDFSDNCTPEQKAEIEKLLKEQWGKTGKAGSILMNVEPEFQPGEMVEASDASFMTQCVQCMFTGGYHSDGRPIIESCGVIYPMKYIRKIQPDPEKEIKAKVAQLKSKYIKGTACSGKGGTNSPYKIYDYMFEDNGLDEMLIEALKTEVK